MPNWCNNYLVLEHEDPEMITRARKAFNEGKLLEEFCPVPASLHIVAGSVSDPDEQKKLEEDSSRNLEVHGYANWYDYCVNEWGTKWDVGGDGGIDSSVLDTPNTTSMSFDSAWAPPIAAMEKFQDLGFKVKLIYWESGMCFCGMFDENGDDYYEYSDMSVDELAECINPEIDECMCIVENLREWESMEEQDE